MRISWSLGRLDDPEGGPMEGRALTGVEPKSGASCAPAPTNF
jgi:hypothetical protein